MLLDRLGVGPSSASAAQSVAVVMRSGMRKLESLCLVLLLVGTSRFPLVAQEPTAKEEFQKDRRDSAQQIGNASTGARTVTGALSHGGVGAFSGLLTGLISTEMQKRLASSEMAMNLLQQGMADAISRFLTRREREPYTCTAAKVEGLAVFTIKAPSMTQAKAEALIKEEPLMKYRKCGFDRVVFASEGGCWGYDTAAK